MFDYRQYKRGYFMPPVECNDWVKKEYIDKAPVWCSVDLRDGNQALVEPMSLDESLNSLISLLRLDLRKLRLVSRQHQRQSMSFAVHLLRRI